jgi:phosphoglycerate dehydrogenase-like enzyme
VHFELVSVTEETDVVLDAAVDFKAVGSAMAGMRAIVAEATAPEVAVGGATDSVVVTAATWVPSMLAMAIEVAAMELRSEAAEC